MRVASLVAAVVLLAAPVGALPPVVCLFDLGVEGSPCAGTVRSYDGAAPGRDARPETIAASGSFVYVGGASSPSIDPTSPFTDGYVIAWDGDDLAWERVWSDGYLPSAMHPHGDSLLGVFSAFRLRALDAASGTSDYETESLIVDDAAGTPVASALDPQGTAVAIAGRTLHPGAPRALLALREADDGSIRWQRDHPAPSRDAAVAFSPDGGTVFVAGSDGTAPSTGRIEAYDATTGALAWRRMLDSPAIGLAVVDGTRLVALGLDRAFPVMWGIDPATGAIAWNWTATSPTPDVPLLAAEAARVYVAWTEGQCIITCGVATLRALEPATGTLLWSASAPPMDLVRGIVVDEAAERVFIAGRGMIGVDIQAAVAGFDAATGAYQWGAVAGSVQGVEFAEGLAASSGAVHVLAAAYEGFAPHYDSLVISYDASRGLSALG